MTIDIIHGDSKEVLSRFPDNYFHAVITDPPYEIEFMNKDWDKSGIAYDVSFWKEVFRVVKPGGYISAFSATSTYHRVATAIESAGFIIRDQIEFFYDGDDEFLQFFMSLDDKQKRAFFKLIEQQNNRGMFNWIFSQGMPKGQNMRKSVERYLKKHPQYSISEEELQIYESWHTMLKPANEPICLAIKPHTYDSITECFLNEHTGALNIDACRIPRKENDRFDYGVTGNQKATTGKYGIYGHYNPTSYTPHKDGRFPANIVMNGRAIDSLEIQEKDASRFYYCAKAKRSERGEYNTHLSVKPIELMKWLVRLLSPKDAIILDPFAGSGSTLLACLEENVNAVGIEKEAEYVEITKRRIEEWKMGK